MDGSTYRTIRSTVQEEVANAFNREMRVAREEEGDLTGHLPTDKDEEIARMSRLFRREFWTAGRIRRIWENLVESRD